MGFFKKSSNVAVQDRPAFVPPPGLTTTPQQLVRSVPFTYVETQQPAVSLSKEVRDDAKHISLVKGFDAMKAALENCGMAGLRAEIIVMVDDSGSIQYEWSAILQILVRYLGAALNLSASGTITVITYGNPTNPILITKDNYLQVKELVRPSWGGTPMGATLEAALAIAEGNNSLTIIGNLTDGNPTELDRNTGLYTTRMSNAVIRSSGHPVMLKNLAVKTVPYLEEIDDLPSQIEIEKDAAGNPVKDSEGNLKLYRNPKGLRLIDNVDSQEVADPFTMSDEDFAKAFAEEIEPCIEVMAHAGILTDVPGHSRTF